MRARVGSVASSTGGGAEPRESGPILMLYLDMSQNLVTEVNRDGISLNIPRDCYSNKLADVLSN